MTDPAANRIIRLALGIQSGLEKVDYSQTLLNPSSQIDFPVAFVISHYLYNVTTLRVATDFKGHKVYSIMLIVDIKCSRKL